MTSIQLAQSGTGLSAILDIARVYSVADADMALRRALVGGELEARR